MANYITKADIIEQMPEEYLIQITDDENSGAVNDARVNAAIGDAEGEVDGYLQTRYTVPLSPVPVVIKKCAVDIAIYNLYARRDATNDEREKRYKNAIKFLENLSKGIVSLGASSPLPEDGGTGISMKSEDRVFTRKDLEGF